MSNYLKAVDEVIAESVSSVVLPRDLREAVLQDVFGPHLEAVLAVLLDKDSQTARWVSQQAYRKCANPLWMKENK